MSFQTEQLRVCDLSHKIGIINDPHYPEVVFVQRITTNLPINSQIETLPSHCDLSHKKFELVNSLGVTGPRLAEAA